MIMTSEEIKRLRDRAHMTQQEFANAMELGISTVQKWEGGKKPGNMANNLLREFEKSLLAKESS